MQTLPQKCINQYLENKNRGIHYACVALALRCILELSLCGSTVSKTYPMDENSSTATSCLP